MRNIRTTLPPALLKWIGSALLLVAALSSCRKDDDYFKPGAGKSGNLIEQLRADPDYSTFVQGLEMTKLDRTIGSSGLFTVFAPTNAAFEEFFSTGPFKSLDEIPPTDLYLFLGNHIVSPMMFTFDLSARRFNNKKDDRYQSTITLKFNKVVIGPDAFTVNGVPVLPDKRDVEAANGAIHGISRVISLTAALDRQAESTPAISIFGRALQRFSFPEYDPRRSFDLNDDGRIDSVFIERSRLPLNAAAEDPEITALAPTNEAFMAFLGQFPQYKLVGTDSLDMPDNVLRPLIEYHLLQGAKRSTDLTGTLTTSLNGEKLPATAIQPVQPNIMVSNGVLHIIGSVLTPPSLGTVGGQILLNRDKDLNAFITALEKVPNLLNDLRNPARTFTVFAPTNAAFANAGIDVAKATGTVLEPFLRSHVIAGKVTASAFVNDKYYATNQGPGLKLTGSLLTDARGQSANIIATDLAGSNGVFHKIDNVLGAPTGKVLDDVLSQPQFSELKAALDKAGLRAELDKPGPFTLFAPTNGAFQDLYAQLGIAGLASLNAAQLKEMLQHHVLPTRVFSTDITGGMQSTPLLAGRKITYAVANGTVTLADQNTVSPDATITAANRQGANGVVHVIDKVLQP